MTYKMNGTELTIQPTVGRWTERLPVDIDGNGHPIYSPYHEFELRWQLVDMEQAQQLRTFFLAVGSTGTVVVDLPQFAYNPYTFYAYSGCVIHEPVYGEYFSEHQLDVLLLVTKIKV